MVCPTPRSGRLGFVGDYTGASLTRYSRVRNWQLDAITNPQTRTYSGTRFGTQRIPGFINYTGSFEGFGARPPLFVGDTFTFFGYTAPTTGVACTPGCAYHCPAIVDSLSITWNWTAENRDMTWNIGFSSTGDLTTLASFDDPCDDAVFCDANTCDLEFRLKDPCNADAAVEFCNLTSATLTFTANNLEYSNSSTSCRVKKEVGNLDWRLEVVDQNPCIIPTLQSIYWIEIEDTASTYWSLKWGMFTGVSGLRVDTESGEMISKTNVFEMQAVNCCVPGTPVRGAIIDPLVATKWPYA